MIYWEDVLRRSLKESRRGRTGEKKPSKEVVSADIWCHLFTQGALKHEFHEQLLHLEANRVGICTPMSVNHWLQAIPVMQKHNFVGPSGLGHSHQPRVILRRSGPCVLFTANTRRSGGGEGPQPGAGDLGGAPTTLLPWPKVTTLVTAELGVRSRFPWSFMWYTYQVASLR